MLRVDIGYLDIGLSVFLAKKELFSDEVKLLQNISYRLLGRLMYCTDKTKDCVIVNHDSKIEKSWLTPSIQNKLDSHYCMIEKIISFFINYKNSY